MLPCGSHSWTQPKAKHRISHFSLQRCAMGRLPIGKLVIVGLSVTTLGVPKSRRKRNDAHRGTTFLVIPHQQNQQLLFATFVSKMARLNSIPKNTLIRNLPDGDKMWLALQWLRENPTEAATTVANEHSVRQAWRREKKRTRDRRNRLQ